MKWNILAIDEMGWKTDDMVKYAIQKQQISVHTDLAFDAFSQDQ